jgi:hypothetical protein
MKCLTPVESFFVSPAWKAKSLVWKRTVAPVPSSTAPAECSMDFPMDVPT